MTIDTGTSPATDTPHILLVNPWIHDFAAYDYWAAPLGLLQIAGILRHHGYRVSYIDCLDRFHPRAEPAAADSRHGRGPYRKTPIPKPPGLEDIARTYSRYGISPDWFLDDLSALPAPHLVMVTSLMTYWYPGVIETITAIRSVHPDVPIYLGGIYATLCTDHALSNSGADRVIPGMAEASIVDTVGNATGFRPPLQIDPNDMDTWPYPALDLQRQIPFVPIMTSRGCPFRCAYCASRVLNPVCRRRSPSLVVDEIRYWHRRSGCRDMVFYDDALLVDAEEHIIPILEAVVAEKLPVRFHTPNALHLRHISPKVARLMKRSGFETIRLGLESMDFAERNSIDRKVEKEEFLEAVRHLRDAGFEPSRLGAYLLAGLPGQSTTHLEETIRLARDAGISPVLAHYTPIPHTEMWEAAVSISRYDLAADPVYTNNAVFPCLSTGFSWEILTRLKQLARGER